MSPGLRESDEVVERALFERRARAAGASGGRGVPSLEAVLRAARDDSREAPGGRGRAWTGLALAAACLVTVVKTRPRDVSPAAITADIDRAGGATTERAGGTCEEPAASTLEPAYASVAPPVQTLEGRACVAPPVTYEPPRSLSCDRDDANRTDMP